MNIPPNTISGIPSAYVCPVTRQLLYETDSGFVRSDGFQYPHVNGWNGVRIPDFVQSNELGETGKKSIDMYNQSASVGMYRNFLSWLFETFAEDETNFRSGLLKKTKVKPGDRVLIIGCGLGDDIPPLLAALGHTHKISVVTEADAHDFVWKQFRDPRRTSHTILELDFTVHPADAE